MQEKNNKSPNEADIYVGAQLRKVRKQSGISQRALASSVHVTFQQIQKYEKGINRISVGTLYDICKALKIAPVKLLQPAYET